MTSVAVVGAGWSGLFIAAALSRRGAEVTLVERGDMPGGVAATEEIEGYRLEPGGATFLLPHPHLSALLPGAGLVPAPAAGRRFVATHDGLVELKPGPGMVAAPLLSWQGKLVAVGEPWRGRAAADGDETLEDFAMRRFGPEAGGLVATLMAAGVFAGDPTRLSAAAAFPRMVALEQASGSLVRGGLQAMRRRGVRPVTHVPVGGMRTLASRMLDEIDGVKRFGVAVEGLTRTAGGWRLEGAGEEAEHVVLAVAPMEAARLVPDQVLAARLEQAEAAPVALVFLGGEGNVLPDAFGYLNLERGSVVVGGLFESSLDPDRVPSGHWLVKLICGGALRSEVVEWPEERLVESAGVEFARALGRDVDASFVHVVRHTPGIPQYPVGHAAWLRAVEERLGLFRGLHLTGWGYRGVGLAHQAEAAVRLAERLF